MTKLHITFFPVCDELHRSFGRISPISKGEYRMSGVEMSEWIKYLLMGALPIGFGLLFCIKSPFAKGQKTKCYYCKERISVSARICPYCRRKNSSLGLSTALKSRLGQFTIGFFLGIIIEALIIAFGFKLLKFLGF